MSLFAQLFSRSALPLLSNGFGEAVFVRENKSSGDYKIVATAAAPRTTVEAAYEADLTTRNLDWLITPAELRKLPFEITQASQIRRSTSNGIFVYMPTPNASGAIWSPDDDESLVLRYRCLFTGEESV